MENRQRIAGLSLRSTTFTGFLHTRKMEVLHLPRPIHVLKGQDQERERTQSSHTGHSIPPTLFYAQRLSVLSRSPEILSNSQDPSSRVSHSLESLHILINMQRPWDLCNGRILMVCPTLAQTTSKTSGRLAVCPFC